MQVLVQLYFVMVVLYADVDKVLQLMEASKESLCDDNGKDIMRIW